MEKYRIILAEDRTLYRLYFENMFRNSSRYTLVGTEDNMEEAVKRCAHTPVDLILTAAADKNGSTNFAAAAACKRDYSHVRIVMMTDTPEHSYLQRAEACGADGFWYAEKKQSILSVLDRTMEGETVFPSHLPSVKVGQMESRVLTEKELLILREVAKGCSNKEIAETLRMSLHRAGLCERNAGKNRTAQPYCIGGGGGQQRADRSGRSDGGTRQMTPVFCT
ncbi:MAG: response regulator transcription factor [Anaerotignum sp.]|nr:response regulator transcription factor [Anaerotignum sp.]